MMKVRKKQGKQVQAWQLKSSHPVLQKLIEEGKIRSDEHGRYEVFSQEALNGNSGQGQKAVEEDWIRIDSAGCPYPCSNAWFQANMKHIHEDLYEQIPQVLEAWRYGMPVGPEVLFLVQEKGLVIDPFHPDRGFQAPLWGTWEAAGPEAVLIFYSITRNSEGAVVDAEFNFVEKNEFDKSYEVL